MSAETTAAQAVALRYARELSRVEVALFLAAPDPGAPTGYRLPGAWQQAPVDPTVVDAWRPGWALCAVMGGPLDLIDIDPRSGGELPTVGSVRPVCAAHTPSGGAHLFVVALGAHSRDGAWPGVDYKGGAPDGSGRGFAFIAPTVRRSKVDGTELAYRWSVPPDELAIREAQEVRDRMGPDPGLAELLVRLHDLRAPRAALADGPSRRLSVSAARAEWDRAVAALAADVAAWARAGWGGEAHAGLLRATTHLARLAPDEAEAGVHEAFARAGVAPDSADLVKLDSAVAVAVADEVLPDAEFSEQELFWQGVTGEDTRTEAGLWDTGWDATTAWEMAQAARWRREKNGTPRTT